MTLRVSPAEVVASSTSPLVSIAGWWKRIRLGDLVEITNGAPYQSARFNTDGRGLPVIRIRDVGKPSASTFYDGEYEERHVVEHGDLLVGMDGDFRAARWAGSRSLLNQRVCRLRLRSHADYSTGLLAHVVQPYLDEIHKVTSVVTVKHLSSKSVEDLPVPLPPRAEQERIVAAIEEHLSRLDAAEEGVRSSLTRLRVFWTQTLAASFSEFEASRPISELAEVRGGIQKQPKRKPVKHTAPFLRVANVLRGRLELKEVHQIELFDGELDRYRLEEGDLLVVEGNGSPEQIGRAARWADEVPGSVHQNHLIRVRPGPDLDPDFLDLYWNAPTTASVLREVASSTSGLYTLSTRKVKDVPVPVASVDRQRAVAAELRNAQAMVARLETELTAELARGQALRRSILAAAFSGRLVAQHPADESADVLLARIAEQRSSADTKSKTLARAKTGSGSIRQKERSS